MKKAIVHLKNPGREIAAFKNQLSANIPVELQSRNQWLGWIFGVCGRGKKPSKIPLCVNGFDAFSFSNPSTWGKFGEVVSTLGGSRQGIGFLFTSSDPYCGIDLDNCRDPVTGEIEPWAIEIIEQINSYTEISPSGKGVHIIAIATC